MTRENKLALVIGFALILMVGILISDHFSTARAQDPARLSDARPVDPLVHSPRSEPMLVDLRPVAEREVMSGPRNGGLRPGPVASNQGAVPERMVESDPVLAQHFVPVEEPAPISMRDLDRIVIGGAARNNGNVNAGQAESAGVIFHEVQPGESLSSIAHRHYGDRSLANALAKFNNISDANAIRAHHRLRIPPVNALRPGAAPPAQRSTTTVAANVDRSASPASQPKLREYTIKGGDNLSEISQRFLGTSRRWREIHELNREAIRDPDNIPAGVTIRIPQR